jgi:GTPase SAR1 family protein
MSNKQEHGKEDFGIAILGPTGGGKTSVVTHKLHQKFEEKQDETIWDTVRAI